MRVLYKPVGDTAHIVQINNTLEALQKAVGGYIQGVPLTEDTYVICDEEGRLKGKKHNCVLNGVDYVGDILIIGTSAEDFADLPVKADIYLKQQFPELWR